MDTIDFRIGQTKTHNNSNVLEIFINNENLINLLKEYEMQFDEKIAGKYEGLLLHYFDEIDIEMHFIGIFHYKMLLGYRGKAQILECSCHEVGCWPFLVKINECDNIICWNNYEQPHRRKESKGGFWDYSNFKIFEFDKLEYQNKLITISKEIESLNVPREG
jgi:hypothetical protein